MQLVKKIGWVGLFFLLILGGCKKDHCENGSQDKDETGVDCGGLDCTPCVSCFDGVQNQGETGVDCGGPCEPCDLPWRKARENGDNLSAVDFSGAVGIAVGDNGTVLKSNDSGKTWNTLTSGTTEDLLEVDVIDETHFFICGKSDVVLASTDGSTISTKSTGESEQWNDLHFIDNLNGMVCGSGQRIMRTNDGGNSWTQVYFRSSNNSFQAMSFLDDTEGYAFGGFRFLKTIDGGLSWAPIEGFERTSEFRDIRDLYYKTASDAYCLTELGMHILIPDWQSGGSSEGKPWVNKQLDVKAGKIDFFSTIGLYAGKNQEESQGLVMISFDGGARWTKQSVSSGIKYSDGTILSDEVMVVVGDNGTILRRDK